MKKNKKPKKQKTDIDLREDGITLILHSLKARLMAEPLLDSYFSGITDGSDKDWACYMLTQSIELALKGIISYYGDYFREGHFVAFNAKKVEELSETNLELREIQNSITDLVSPFASVLYKWSNLARYKDLRVQKQHIEKAVEISDDLVAFLRRHEMNVHS